MNLGRFLLSRRAFAALAVACTAAAGALAAAAPSQASAAGAAAAQAALGRAAPARTAPARATAPVPVASSAAPVLPAGAVRAGTLPAATTMHVEVTLNVPDQARLTAFLNGLDNSASPYYQKFLKPGQFGPEFGPSTAQISQVENALKSAGLNPGPVSSDRLSIPVTAPASAIERAFGVTLASYRLSGDRTVYANTAAPKLPAAIAADVQGVLGLSDLYQDRPLGTPRTTATAKAIAPAARVKAVKPSEAVKPVTAGTPGAAVKPDATGPQPCSTIQGVANTADVFAGYYGMQELYTLGDLGKGARIAVLELEPNLPSDITAYEQCYGISTKVNYLKVDGGAGTGAGSGEAALDIETIASFVPDATIDVYQAPNTGSAPGGGDYDIFKSWVTSDTDKLISVSWGACEAEEPAADLKAEETLFEQANAQGQSVFSAAGDEGSTGCYNPNTGTSDTRLSPVTPAADPYVISVGGTSFSQSGSGQSEIVWNDSSAGTGAGGGGVSSTWCMPAYQHQTSIPGLINGDSKKDTSSSCSTKYFRQSPDISADGDPDFGYVIYYDGGWENGIGGTSAATPLLASVAALTQVSPYCSAYAAKNPALPQNLYNAAATYHSYIYGSAQGIRDIKSGNNDYTDSGYTGGLYPAGTGYDMASGLGAPIVAGLSGSTWSPYVAGLTAMLCHQAATKLKTVSVSSVSPSAGKAGASAKVTVHGSGFLPISGADQARVYRGATLLATVGASCTTTACTVTVPKESAGTVDIKIFAGSLWSSPTVSGDRYTYANAPKISSASPAKGSTKGGTKITIKGSNFYDVSAVTFGSKKGTSVKVVSASELTVVSPSGSGTVKITVTAGGGTSNSVSYKYD